MKQSKFLVVSIFVFLSVIFCSHAAAPAKKNEAAYSDKKSADKDIKTTPPKKIATRHTLYNAAETKKLQNLFKQKVLDPKAIVEALKAHANPNAIIDGRPILAIALKNNKQLVSHLLNNGAIPNLCDSAGVSAISYVNSIEEAELLLKDEEYLEPDSFGNNPLHHLVSGARLIWGNYDKLAPHAVLIPYYIKRGIDKNAINNSGLTPLMGAIEHGNLDMVIALCNNNVDRDLVDSEGNSVIVIAQKKYEEEDDGEKKDRYFYIWTFLHELYYNKHAFLDKNYNEIIADLKKLGLLMIPLTQMNNRLFNAVWVEAHTKKDKDLAITYLITALIDMRKQGKNIDNELVAAEEFIKKNAHQLSEFAKERSFERLNELKNPM